MNELIHVHGVDIGVGADAFRLIELGTVGYREALGLQLELHSQVRDGRLGGALILLEHDPVITTGVGTHAENLLAPETVLRANGIDLVESDRGGDATYHGPGQLVAYPIVNLRGRGNDVHEFLRLLENVVISTLSDLGLEGTRHGRAGVWVGGKKVCSIGIAVRRGITYHGLALNVSPNMRHFAFINPCGLESSMITSLEELVAPVPGIPAVRERLAEHFLLNLGIERPSR